jgi:6-phosphofructokinase 1
VAVLAEGLAEIMNPEDFAGLASVSRDEHGHVELADLDLGRTLKEAVLKRLAPYGLKPTIRLKDLGFELRCSDPIPFDMEYCRDLGCCAAEFLLSGGTGAMVSIVNGQFAPIPFANILDPATQRTRVRMVNVKAEPYRIARRFMVRLERKDLEESERLARCAAVVDLTAGSFRERFGSVVDHAPDA